VHAVTWLIVAPAAVLAVAGVLIWARFFPYRPCPSCRGRRGRGLGSTARAYNRCRRCGGSGEQIRPISRIYRKWNEEAKRMKASRK
jgi:hypothetical protein